MKNTTGKITREQIPTNQNMSLGGEQLL